MIILIFVASQDGVHPRTNHVDYLVHDRRRISAITQLGRKACRPPRLLIPFPNHQQAAIGAQVISHRFQHDVPRGQKIEPQLRAFRPDILYSHLRASEHRSKLFCDYLLDASGGNFIP